ncbi:MAG: tRNA threonylcarbamoyladenosine dehydratase [Candidatus Rifleibacteriota bacterium]
MDRRFQRTELLLGSDAARVLNNSHVAVFGLGGVGSYAAESLARSGIGKITLIDFDYVGLTNINRQNIAFSNNIGQAKTEVMRQRIELINPDCLVEPLQVFFCEENSDEILNKNFDAVIDAIDSFNPKIRLIVETLKRKIPLFSAMGAAGKINPTMIRVGDISKSTVCPLAKRIRKRLRSFNITTGFQVVYSIEPPILPFSPDLIEQDMKEFSLKRGRERMIQGSISHLTAIFGLTLAGMVIQKLTGFNTARETPAGKRKKGTSYFDL